MNKIILFVNILLLLNFKQSDSKSLGNDLILCVQQVPSFCTTNKNQVCTVNFNKNGCIQGCWCVDRPILRYPENEPQEN